MRNIFILAFCCISLVSCDNKAKKRPETALDTGREFIRTSLNGEFEEAALLIWEDSANKALFESYRLFYQRMPEEKKENYRSASFEINKILDIDDSTTIINFSNSYMNRPMDIKLIRKKDSWWVDFKYAYSGNLPID